MSEPDINISSFEVLTKLSSGGMGDVLLARRHGVLGFEKLLAIKTIRGDLAKRPDIRAMFLDEARLVARLHHSSITQVYDFGEEEGTLYLAMEYVPGVGLNKLLVKRGGPFPPLVAARLVAGVARGLHAAHTVTDLEGNPLSVVHREVTPGNIILTYDGHLKIIDFGIALMKNRESPDTQVGELKGKPSYMAPEQIRGERVDRRSDIYSLSVVLHELLTGRKLFSQHNVVATVLAVEQGAVPLPSSIVSGLPDAIDDIVMKGLQRNPRDRFDNAREMAKALEHIVKHGGGLTMEEFAEAELVEERRTHNAWLHAVLSPESSDPGTLDDFRESAAIAPLLAARQIITKDESANFPEEKPAEARLVESTTLVPPRADSVDIARIRPKTPQRSLLGLLIAFCIGLGAFLSYEVWHKPAIEPISPLPPSEVANNTPSGDDLRTATASTAQREDLKPTPTATEAATAMAAQKPTKKRRKLRKRNRRPTKRKVKADPSPSYAPASYGYITVHADPYAFVKLNGKQIGATPIMKKRLRTGSYRLQLVSPDSGEVRKTRTIVIKEGQHERVLSQ